MYGENSIFVEITDFRVEALAVLVYKHTSFILAYVIDSYFLPSSFNVL